MTLRPAVLLCVLSLATPAAEPALEALYAGFRNPPPQYSVTPYWFWNGKVTAAETRRQIQEMARQGVHGAVIMNWAGLEPAYLSEAYWREVGVALDAARDAGVTLNFADEYLWPSGQAWDYASLNREPSRVLQLHPEYRMKRLTLTEGAEQPQLVVAARVSASGVIDESTLKLVPADWRPPDAMWKRFAYTLVPAFERGTRVDLLNPAAVKVFIDLVYGEYARRFPRHLGSTIQFFLSDHEGIYGVPLHFTPALWETFQQRHGYDLRPYLPIVESKTTKAQQVRQDYLETLAHMYATSFTAQVTEWCTRHGVRHGHSDIEESLRLQVGLAGDMFALWRASSAVYIDALVNRARMPIDFMEARSVAHFESTPFFVENQGLVGNDSYWSLEKARLGTNMCLLWGVNRLIGHYFEYDPEHLQYPPSFFLTQPLWRYFHLYAGMARRALYMNAQGRHDAHIAIYHPLESAFAGSETLFKEGQRDYLRWGNSMDQTQDYYTALQLELTRLGWDYHMLDSHYLAKAEVAAGEIRLAGERFRVLLLPPMTHISASSAERIRRFAAAGGVVLALGAQPKELDNAGIQRFAIGNHKPFMDKLDYTVQIEAPEGVRADLVALFSALRAVENPEIDVVDGTRDHLFFARRFTAGAEWYWAVNDTADARRVKVRFRQSGHFEKWNAENGERTLLPATDGVITLDFGPWDAFFVVRHNGAPAAAAPLQTERRVLLDLANNTWNFTPEAPMRVPYAKVDHSREWLAPERLANRDWWLAGPYPYADHGSFFDAFEPEKGFNAADPAWRWTTSSSYIVRPPSRNGIFYAYVNVWSPTARQARAAVVAYDGVTMWWNGKREFTAFGHPPFVHVRDAWAHRPAIDIKQGWNTLMLKIAPASAGATSFMFRIADHQGNALRDLVYSRDQVLVRMPKRRVHISAEAPLGTAGPSISRTISEDAIPERPFEFAPRTAKTKLVSWTDAGLEHYSGTAIYETTFTLPSVPTGERLLLDLGAVGLAAEVWINNTKAGERAWRPYEIDITGFVRRGENTLRIRVANSNAGWMAQGDAVYAYGRWGVKFHSERERIETLRPNGLEGPVRILAVR